MDKLTEPTPEEISKVVQALESDKSIWKTVRGVAKETNLDIATVENALLKEKTNIVRSSVLSSDGEQRYTTRKHFNRKATLMEKFFGALKNRVD